MNASTTGTSTVLERTNKTQHYPEARVIVLDDDFNTFNHVVKCLKKIVPAYNLPGAIKFNDTLTRSIEDFETVPVSVNDIAFLFPGILSE